MRQAFANLDPTSLNKPQPSQQKSTAGTKPSRELWDRIDTFLLQFWTPDVTAIQKANIIDDWARGLSDVPFQFVSGSIDGWMRDPKNTDDKGRSIKPALATIRRMAQERQRDAEMVNAPFLPPPTWPIGHIHPSHDSPKYGGILGSSYTHEDSLAWFAHRQAWFDSPDYPHPPSKAKHKDYPHMTVEAYWEQFGRPADANTFTTTRGV